MLFASNVWEIHSLGSTEGLALLPWIFCNYPALLDLDAACFLKCAKTPASSAAGTGWGETLPKQHFNPGARFQGVSHTPGQAPVPLRDRFSKSPSTARNRPARRRTTTKLHARNTLFTVAFMEKASGGFPPVGRCAPCRTASHAPSMGVTAAPPPQIPV